MGVEVRVLLLLLLLAVVELHTRAARVLRQLWLLGVRRCSRRSEAAAGGALLLLLEALLHEVVAADGAAAAATDMCRSRGIPCHVYLQNESKQSGYNDVGHRASAKRKRKPAERA